MKFDIPKIVRPLELKDYATEYGDLVIQVWVNPPVRLLQEHNEILRRVSGAVYSLRKIDNIGPEDIANTDQESNRFESETMQKEIMKAADELTKIFAELWSQGDPDTRWTEDDVRKLVDDTQETDPLLWPWLRNQTIDLIHEHRTRIKKG